MRDSFHRLFHVVIAFMLMPAFPNLAPHLHGQNVPSPQAAGIKPLSDLEADAFLADMARALSGIETLEADFVQKRSLAVFMDTLVSRGFFCFRVPSSLRWEVLESYHTILIFNGKNVAKFDFQNGKMRSMKLGTEDLMRQILGQIVFWMKGDFASSSQMYAVEVFAGDPYRVVLKPKSEALRRNLRSIELGVDRRKWRVAHVTIEEPAGDSVKIAFSSDRTNVPIPENAFDLVNPAPRNWLP